MIPSGPPLLIAVAVVISEGHVLVGRRAIDARDAAGHAEFPGGMVEAGETPEEAAARECLEETGVVVLIGNVLDVATTGSSRGPIEIRFYEARPSEAASGPRHPFRWLPITDLAFQSFPPPNARVVARLLAHRGGA